MSIALVHRGWMFFGDHAMCCAVVGLDGCGCLLVAHFFEQQLHGDCFPGVDVEGT